MLIYVQYELERRAFALELIEFDKWYAEGFSSKARIKLQEETGVALPGPFECVYSSSISLLTNAAIRAFIAASNLTSGCGVRYEPSSIVAEPSTAATGLVVGKRLLPQMLLRLADHAPLEIQDICPSDGRFKLFVFASDLATPDMKDKLTILASQIESTLRSFPDEVISVFTVVKALSDAYTYLDVPPYLRPDWTRQDSSYF